MTRFASRWRDLGRLADLYVNSEHDRQLALRTAIQAFAAFSTWAVNHGEIQRNDAENELTRFGRLGHRGSRTGP
jgi:hypothetical protein